MRLLALSLALMITCGTADQASAEADGPDYYRVTGVAADDVLNIRAEPNASSEKIGEFPPETDGVRNLGCEGGLSLGEWQEASQEERDAAKARRWCRIEHNDTTGWVAARYLAEGSAPTVAAGGSNWRIIEVAELVAEGDASLSFQADGTLAGSTGCNRFNGMASIVDGRSLTLSPLAMTRMACPGAMAAQEQAVVEALQSTLEIAYDPIADRLWLTSDGDGSKLILERQP